MHFFPSCITRSCKRQEEEQGQGVTAVKKKKKTKIFLVLQIFCLWFSFVGLEVFLVFVCFLFVWSFFVATRKARTSSCLHHRICVVPGGRQALVAQGVLHPALWVLRDVLSALSPAVPCRVRWGFAPHRDRGREACSCTSS